MEAGKSRLAGDIKREANSVKVHDLKNENTDLKLLVTEQSLHIRALKKAQLVPNKLSIYET